MKINSKDFRVQPGEEVVPLGTFRIVVRKPAGPPDRRHVLKRQSSYH